MIKLPGKKAQTLIEYTAVIVALITACLAIQFYAQRAIQGRFRETSDQIGGQYEPGNTTGNMTTYVERDIFTAIVTEAEPNTIVDGVPGYGTYEFEVTNSDYTLTYGTETVGP